MPNNHNYPTELYETVKELPSEIDQTQLNSNGLWVVEGLTLDLARQLVETTDQSLTGGIESAEQTVCLESLEKVIAWQARGRLVLPLVKKTSQNELKLVGLGSFSKVKPGKDELSLSRAKTAFNVQLHDADISHSFGSSYVNTILQAHSMRYGNKGLWLKTWLNNKDAIAAYKQAGFKEKGILLAEHGPNERKLLQYMMMLGESALNDSETESTSDQ